MITIRFKLGEESGTLTAKNDREATKINDELFGRKLAMSGIDNFKQFRKRAEHFIYLSSTWSGKKKIKRDPTKYEDLKRQIERLASVSLSVSISRS